MLQLITVFGEFWCWQVVRLESNQRFIAFTMNDAGYTTIRPFSFSEVIYAEGNG